MAKQTHYNGKLAFITGGSEGIGLAVAQDLVRSGAHVIICSRSGAKLAAALKTLEALRLTADQNIASAPLDVTHAAETQSVIDGLVQKYGIPDYFINCAGVALPGYLGDIDLDAYRQMMDLNYFGLLHTARAIVPHLVRGGKGGHIVNTSSMAGFLGLFGYTGYCASKYAAVGFSQALRHELKNDGIRVSVLCPPNTRTPGLDRENLTKPKEVLKLEEKAKPVGPEQVSTTLLKALRKGQFMIVPTFDGGLAYFLSRHLPAVIDQFIKRPKSA